MFLHSFRSPRVKWSYIITCTSKYTGCFTSSQTTQNNLSFSELLDLDNSVTVHQKNLQVLVTEIYKVKNGIAPEIMKDIFELQNPSYNLRSTCNQFRRENIKTVHYGLQSVRYLGPKIWELVPNNIKYCDSLSKFRKLIKSWRLESCPCRLCKTYIAHLGFI